MPLTNPLGFKHHSLEAADMNLMAANLQTFTEAPLTGGKKCDLPSPKLAAVLHTLLSHVFDLWAFGCFCPRTQETSYESFLGGIYPIKIRG